jgi:hypothetical protein
MRNFEWDQRNESRICAARLSMRLGQDEFVGRIQATEIVRESLKVKRSRVV